MHAEISGVHIAEPNCLRRACYAVLMTLLVGAVLIGNLAPMTLLSGWIAQTPQRKPAL